MSGKEIQNIVIVGAGNGGIFVFNGLSSQLDPSRYNIILINNRPFFNHRPAGLRLLVDGEGIEDRVLMPLEESKFNTGNKKLIVGEVTSIVDDGTKGRYVELNSGEQVHFSTLILSPGSVWEGLLDFGNTKSEIVELAKTWRARFQKARNIVIVGGGSIGAELAGEIRDLGEDKNVTIVHGQRLMMNDSYPDRWRKRVGKDLDARGVKLVLGEYVDEPEVKDGHVYTRTKKAIKADLVVTTKGPSRPNTKFVESLGSEVLTAKGNIKVLPTLQLPRHERIFALGDAIEWKEEKQAAKIEKHAAVIINNVLVLQGKKNKMIPYKGTFELIVLTNGKSHGSSYFAVLWGIILGSWFTKMAKSKDVLITMMKKKLQL